MHKNNGVFSQKDTVQTNYKNFNSFFFGKSVAVQNLLSDSQHGVFIFKSIFLSVSLPLVCWLWDLSSREVSFVKPAACF